MTYKLSAETCTTAIAASPAMAGFSVLDARLGLEQIQDHPHYRTPAEDRWAESDPSSVPVGPDDALMAFTTISPRHQALSVDDVRLALTAIVDEGEFQDSCEARWAAYDANPWETQFDSLREQSVDLGAMPDDSDDPMPA